MSLDDPIVVALQQGNAVLQKKVEELEEALAINRGATALRDWHRDTARIVFVELLRLKLDSWFPENTLRQESIKQIVKRSYEVADALLAAEVARINPDNEEDC